MTPADPYRTPCRPIPPRTVFVHPVAFHAIAARHAAQPIERVTQMRMGEGDLRIASPVGEWRIVSDPDCPRDSCWPDRALPVVMSVVRDGVEEVCPWMKVRRERLLRVLQDAEPLMFVPVAPKEPA
jgi:hypothetical protein